MRLKKKLTDWRLTTDEIEAILDGKKEFNV